HDVRPVAARVARYHAVVQVLCVVVPTRIAIDPRESQRPRIRCRIERDRPLGEGNGSPLWSAHEPLKIRDCGKNVSVVGAAGVSTLQFLHCLRNIMSYEGMIDASGRMRFAQCRSESESTRNSRLGEATILLWVHL